MSLPVASQRWSWRHISFWTAALVLACSWQGQRLVRVLRPGPNVTVDFFQEWSAARCYFAGLPVYSPLDEALVERFLGQKPDPDGAFNEVNAHPPPSVLLALPFAALPYNNACLVWNLLSLLALAASLFIVGRQLRFEAVAKGDGYRYPEGAPHNGARPLLQLTRSFFPWAILPWLTLLLCCQPLRDQTYHGQFNLLLLLLIVGAWAAERSERPGLAGVLLGTATALKLFPVVLLLPFLVRRRWRLVGSAAAAAAVWTALTLAVLGVDAFRDYVEKVLPHLQVYRNAVANVSLTGFWQRVFVGMDRLGHTEPAWYNPAAARLALAVSCLAVVALVAWAAARARSRTEADHALGLAVTAMVLVSPIAWNHYFLLLVLPVALLWQSLPSSGVWRPAFWSCVGVLCLGLREFWPAGSETVYLEIAGWRLGFPRQAGPFLWLHHPALLGLFLLGFWNGRRLAAVAALAPGARPAVAKKTKQRSELQVCGTDL